MPNRDENYERRKEATKAAADKDAEEQEALRKRMEAGKAKPPARLTRREVELARRMDDGRGGEVRPKKFGRR